MARAMPVPDRSSQFAFLGRSNAPSRGSWLGDSVGAVGMHGGTAQLDPVGGMDEAVEDGVGDGGIVVLAMPVGNRLVTITDRLPKRHRGSREDRDAAWHRRAPDPSR